MNENKPLPPWANIIPEGAFISYTPTYKVGEYFDRFHKESFKPTDFAPLTYYMYVKNAVTVLMGFLRLFEQNVK